MAPPTFVISTPRSRWSDNTVYGLGDPLAQARILDRPLSEWVAPASLALPTETATHELHGPALVCGRDLWLSSAMAEGFASAAASRPDEIVRLGRDPEGPGRFADPLSRLPRSPEGLVLFDLWFVPRGQSVQVEPDGARLPTALIGAATVDVAGRTQSWDMPIDPEISGEGKLVLQAGALAAVPVGHWVELLRANLLAIAASVLETPLARGAISLIWAIFRAMSLNPFRVLQKITTRGRRCVVHPSAVVEGCHLGDGVKIDAGAVLRGCWIGDGANIGAQAIAEMSVIGEGARLQRRAMANMCVIYPGARSGGILQLALVGRDAVTKMFAVGTDMRLGQSVSVQVPDPASERGWSLSEVDLKYQGVCLGHGSFIGSGVWIAPGRVIAANRKVVRDPGLMVLK